MASNMNMKNEGLIEFHFSGDETHNHASKISIQLACQKRGSLAKCFGYFF